MDAQRDRLDQSGLGARNEEWGMSERLRLGHVGAAVLASAVISLPACGHDATVQSAPWVAEVASFRGLLQPQGGSVCGPMPCIYVANYLGGISQSSSVTAYGSAADLAPTVEISGALTGLSFPAGLARDYSGNLYVANAYASGKAGNSITVYGYGSSGDRPPIRTISGPKTGLNTPYGVAVPYQGEVYVSNLASGSGTASITVFAAGAHGDVKPIRVIRGSKTGLAAPLGITVDDSGGGQIYVTGTIGGGSVSIFGGGTKGNVAPARIISGPKTGLNHPCGIVLDPLDDMYVANGGTAAQHGGSVTEYGEGVSGNVAPIRTIRGDKTGLDRPNGIAMDDGGDIYVTNGGSSTITVYSAGANGNVAPSMIIGGANTLMNGPVGITGSLNGVGIVTRSSTRPRSPR